MNVGAFKTQVLFCLTPSFTQEDPKRMVAVYNPPAYFHCQAITHARRTLTITTFKEGGFLG